MSFVIFDTEYIADKGMYESGFCGWKNREVIQIAAIKVNENLEVEDKLNFYTLPVKHTEIPDYFIKVTGIDNETMRLQGVPFVEAYKRFLEFAKGGNCYSHGWGGSLSDRCDGEILEETAGHYDFTAQQIPQYFNIAPWFKAQYCRHGLDVKTQASGEIAAILGVEQNLVKLGLNPHNAFYDVYSILEGLKYFGFKESDLQDWE